MRKWKRPVIIEIPVGLEINAYACAEMADATSVVTILFDDTASQPPPSRVGFMIPKAEMRRSPLAEWREGTAATHTIPIFSERLSLPL